jgi:polysaccharide export outer membrane protein
MLLISLLLMSLPVSAQEQSASVNPPSASLAKTPATTNEDAHYRIGPGDVLDVKVFGKPQFNREGVKVDPRGMMRMPLVKEEIRAACRTEDELAAEITLQLKEFIRQPEVIVQIKDYQSEPVAVLGSVRTPSRFQLQRRVRLLELITFVNGPTENAGRNIQVVHMGPLATCDQAHPVVRVESVATQVDNYKLADTLRGAEEANPYVRAGDVISIAKADEVYVIGNVIRPTSIALNEPITVSRAIAMAGGTNIDTKKSEIHIVRQLPGAAEKQEIIVDLDAITKHKAEDVVLMANDIVDVPASGGKRWPVTCPQCRPVTQKAPWTCPVPSETAKILPKSLASPGFLEREWIVCNVYPVDQTRYDSTHRIKAVVDRLLPTGVQCASTVAVIATRADHHSHRSVMSPNRIFSNRWPLQVVGEC